MRFRQIPASAWFLWAIVCLVFIAAPAVEYDGNVEAPLALTGVVTHDPQSGSLVPWQPMHRSRRWLRNEFRRQVHRAWQRVHRRAALVKHLTQLMLKGALTMAAVVDMLTRSQLRRQMGALPVLYALLEVLQVQKTINRHCPTKAEVDHGTVTVVMVLNRLMAPRPLYRIADWLARTVLVYQLGVPAEKFNDDRLARTLDAISQHTRDIWQDVVHQALLRADVNLAVIFYDLTAFVLHGSYADSKHVDFGFAHNTPMNKRKFKAGLDVTADGNIPTEYGLWAGRTADMATVQENMDRLCRLLRDHGWSVKETVIIRLAVGERLLQAGLLQPPLRSRIILLPCQTFSSFSILRSQCNIEDSPAHRPTGEFRAWSGGYSSTWSGDQMMLQGQGHRLGTAGDAQF
jgi:hypothetical protein